MHSLSRSGLLESARRRENDLTGSSQSLFVTPPLCRLFESDMHAGSRRKGDKHFEAKSFPFASDQV
jgi:hypothetical protein